jgi:uncharacterized membrane protein YraQ (UPF0718 family)
MKKNNKIKTFVFIILILLFSTFILYSFIIEFKPGVIIFSNLYSYSAEIILMFPFIFILIGLFEVWVKKETVEHHLGKNASPMGYLWAIILGGTTIGPMLVSLPIAYALSKKGARLSVVFTYIGAASVCRIPMTVFEASYLGIQFTLIRYVVSIPLIILASILLGNYLEKRNYSIMEGG